MPLPMPNREESQQNFISRCMGNQTALDDFPEQSQRAAVCHSQWRKREEHSRNMELYSNPVGNYEVREVIHQGRRHLVVPVVMLREGVLSGSHGPLLHLASEYGRIVDSWNGIPVTVNHPEIDGVPVSANSPAVLEEWVVGRVFNSIMDGDRLRAEFWIDEALISRVSMEALNYLRGGRPIDVSVGVFTDDDFAAGDWKGTRYTAIARNHRPDHCSLLPGGTGACSWASGCGVRANQSKEDNDLKTNAGRLKYNGTESTTWTAPTLADFGVEGQWASLSAADKAMIAAHFLIGAASAASFGDLKLPVVNPKTSKLNENALEAVIGGRGAAVQADPGERSRARRMAYRLLNSEFDRGLDVPQNLEEQVKELAAQGLAVNEMGYREIGSKIQAKLDAMDSDTKVHYLEDCFDGHFVYRVEPRSGSGREVVSGPGSANLFKRTYTMAANGDIEFTGEAQPVVKKVEYVTQESYREFIKSFRKEEQKSKEVKENMKKCCQEKIQALIESGFYTEEDRERLETMDEAAIDMLTAGAEKAAGDITSLEAQVKDLKIKKDPTDGKQEPVQLNRETVLKVLKEKPLTQEEYAGLLSEDAQASIAYGQKLMLQERQRLVDGIVANSNGKLAKEFLEKKDMEELRTLAEAFPGHVADYSANGPAVHNKDNGSDLKRHAVYPPCVKVG